MNELEIHAALSRDAYVSGLFRGVYAYDELPPRENVRLPAILVVNTGSRGSRGIHWVVYYISHDKQQFFDSLGNKPGKYHREMEEFIRRYSSQYEYNCMRLQHPGSDLCGDYCLIFARLRAEGISFQDMIGLFSDNLQHNDSMVNLGVP